MSGQMPGPIPRPAPASAAPTQATYGYPGGYQGPINGSPPPRTLPAHMMPGHPVAERHAAAARHPHATVPPYAPQTQQPLLDLWFADRDHGIAIGAYDTYLTTSDGGLSWTSQKFAALPLAAATSEDEFAPDYHLNHIAAANGKLYMAAEAGHLYRSDDGGRNWRTLPARYNRCGNAQPKAVT